MLLLCNKQKIKQMKSDNKNIVNRLEPFDYTTHHRMPKVKLSKKRRRTAYKGVTNQDPVKPTFLIDD